MRRSRSGEWLPSQIDKFNFHGEKYPFGYEIIAFFTMENFFTCVCLHIHPDPTGGHCLSFNAGLLSSLPSSLEIEFRVMRGKDII